MTFVAAHQFAGRDASVSFAVPSAAGEVLLGLVSSPGQMVVSSGAADVSRLSAPSRGMSALASAASRDIPRGGY